MLWPLLLVWVAVLAIMVASVQKGIGAISVVFIPLLVVAFLALVLRSLFLPGAADGLDALFTPEWGALTDAGVWAAAFGQIFLSLSVGFGIMITYASYVGRRTDMTGSGLVVGLANSSFELLAGIGVFAALGFMAQAGGVAVDEVATSGLGLAFVAFPAIISEAPAGALIGVLFLASLVVAGLTSLGVPILDTVDHFINRFGILLVAVVSMLCVTRVYRDLDHLRDHLNSTGSLQLGSWWPGLVGVVTPAALAYVLVDELRAVLDEPYGGYPGWLITWVGWGSAGAVLALALILAPLPWRRTVALTAPTEEDSP